MKRLNPRNLTAALAVAVSFALPATAQDASGPILFTNVHVFDGVNEALIENANVVVTDNLITAVSTEALAVAGGTVIDGGGRTLMPGLIDTHQHLNQGGLSLADQFANLYYIGIAQSKYAEGTLMRGVTSVRDPGGDSMGLKRAIDEGLVPGPRIVSAGPVVGPTNGHGDTRFPYTGHPRFDKVGMTPDRRLNFAYMADGEAEVLAATREILRQGASFIKIMAGGGVSTDLDPIDTKQYTPAEMRAAVAAAADWNTYVGAHAYNVESIRRAIDAGVKVIEHGQQIDDETMRYAVEKGIWFTSQYLVFTIDIPSFTEKARESQRVVLQDTERFFELAKKYNAKLTFGTDLVLGADPMLQTKELVMRKKWFTPYEILVQGTSRPAELIALSGPRNPYPGKLGVIEEGAYADLLLVDGNPLENIDLIGDPEKNFVVIMKDGVIYKNTLQ
ncbi:metal-dependent hydrolase family protein [Pseudothioclava arenosa]|uniref:Hydrolase n=1 Tax=Pseudothioclava arenosa TaxID=1795308 RepID=A0A2A4CK98_9RHOB|nr:amidohydrolase family protein [Pseudothioclava arenosa]PCD75701.1 hydrolase [Pseudothioclava arenosa]